MGATASSEKNSYASPKWWKEAVIYQVYPSSFQSHKGATTGWGTVKGITSRVDYLKSLGVTVLWSSPILQSPQADMGYDISDYKQIDPRYGTLDDVDALVAKLKKHDMRLMMDLVVNHTSNQHSWFLDSRSSIHSPKREWYIWRKPRRRNPATGSPEPPNNWAQILGEANSAWTYDEPTGEYYLSLFTPEQPDLNWENPEVRAAVWDVMHFWLRRGAAGFRMDVINMISKDQSFPDAPVVLPGQKYQPGGRFYENGPRLHEYLGEMHREVLSKYDTITVGEMPDVSDPAEILRTVGADAGELRMIFIFDVVDIDKRDVRMTLKPWDLREFKSIITRWQRVMIENNGWNSVFIENHDNPRSVSRFADDADSVRDKGAKLLALLQTTLGGTLFVYQGEEIGMRNAPRDWDVSEFKDVETLNYWRKCQDLYATNKEMLDHGRAVIDMKARDHARTPMQWSAGENAGFCDPGVRPWMRVIDDYPAINVEQQIAADDPRELSVWQFWQRGLKDRKQHADVFVYGDFEELTPEHPHVYAYKKTSVAGETWLVVLNFSRTEAEWIMPEDLEVSFWPCSTYVKGHVPKPKSGIIPLKPWEGILGKCA